METSDSKLVAANSGLAPLAVWILLPIFGLCSIPAVTGLVTRFLKRDPKQLSYEDEDGKATLESTKAYSARLPKSLIVLAAFTGCAASIALAVLSRPSERHWPENILSIGAWVSIVPLYRQSLEQILTCHSECIGIPGCGYSVKQELDTGLLPRNPHFLFIRAVGCCAVLSGFERRRVHSAQKPFALWPPRGGARSGGVPCACKPHSPKKTRCFLPWGAR